MSETQATLASVRERLTGVDQQHLLHFYDRLSTDQQRSLLAQLVSLDIERLGDFVARYVKQNPSFAPVGAMEPAPYYAADGGASGRAWDRALYRELGEELLRDGKVAAFTVAGGQGTRLGYDGPKGEYPGSAVTGKPLFACLAEWITASRKRWGSAIPWYIMTSPLNNERTIAFFKENGFFGVPESDVMFFIQGVLPSFDRETGRVLLDRPWSVATNPDGHGGSLRALHRSGALGDMRRRGIEQISYVQIDNPLARVIDPVFLGLHVGAPDSSAEMSSKMVAKADPGEKVGIFARVGGKIQVVEYSDLPERLAAERNADGSLRYNAGSIAIHALSVEFVARLNGSGEFALPLHRAEKKVPFVDIETGERIEPESPNAVKLESFVFDAIPMCRSSIVLETERIEEFAPIKNAHGADSPESSRRIQTGRAARWLEGAGVSVARNAVGEPDCTIEISPLTAMDPQDLDASSLPRDIGHGERIAI